MCCRMSASAYPPQPATTRFMAPSGPGAPSPYTTSLRAGELPPMPPQVGAPIPPQPGAPIVPSTPRASSAPDAFDYQSPLSGSDARLNTLATLLAEERARADEVREEALALKAVLRQRDMEIADLRRELATASAAARVFEMQASDAQVGAARLADKLPLREVPPGTLPPSPVAPMTRSRLPSVSSMAGPPSPPFPHTRTSSIPSVVSPTPIRPRLSLDSLDAVSGAPPMDPGFVPDLETPAAVPRAPILDDAMAPPERLPTAFMNTLPPGFIPNAGRPAESAVIVQIPSPGSSPSEVASLPPTTPLSTRSPLSEASEVTSDDIMIYPRTFSAPTDALPTMKDPYVYEPSLPFMMSQMRV
ncbi:hypothetical protein BD626DRAFT_481939 [Schizophyllum amplum]|uniref:Uncharacterized protein n=1 Tax=Schizophyllum amplum TaxID=97359 RepID=A0A550CUP8_9AGAR|nr:hypothetical protein BD626DRAFT_481939 [Auriculariopsis ampla]